MDSKKEQQLIRETVDLIKNNKLYLYMVGFLKSKGAKKSDVDNLILMAKQEIFNETTFFTDFQRNAHMSQFDEIINDLVIKIPEDKGNVAFSYIEWVKKSREDDIRLTRKTERIFADHPNYLDYSPLKKELISKAYD